MRIVGSHLLCQVWDPIAKRWLAETRDAELADWQALVELVPDTSVKDIYDLVEAAPQVKTLLEAAYLLPVSEIHDFPHQPGTALPISSSDLSKGSVELLSIRKATHLINEKTVGWDLAEAGVQYELVGRQRHTNHLCRFGQWSTPWFPNSVCPGSAKLLAVCSGLPITLDSRIAFSGATNLPDDKRSAILGRDVRFTLGELLVGLYGCLTFYLPPDRWNPKLRSLNISQRSIEIDEQVDRLRAGADEDFTDGSADEYP